MALKADNKYEGIVLSGSALIETQTGTLGYQVNLSCADGLATFVIWLTEKNRERAKKYFEILGVSPENLADPTYLEFGLGMEIVGHELTFGTKLEVYRGEQSIKVAWIGRRTSGKPSEAVAQFFGKPKEKEPTKAPPKPSVDAISTKDYQMEDDEIPFDNLGGVPPGEDFFASKAASDVPPPGEPLAGSLAPLDFSPPTAEDARRAMAGSPEEETKARLCPKCATLHTGKFYSLDGRLVCQDCLQKAQGIVPSPSEGQEEVKAGVVSGPTAASAPIRYQWVCVKNNKHVSAVAVEKCPQCYAAVKRLEIRF